MMPPSHITVSNKIIISIIVQLCQMVYMMVRKGESFLNLPNHYKMHISVQILTDGINPFKMDTKYI